MTTRANVKSASKPANVKSAPEAITLRMLLTKEALDTPLNIVMDETTGKPKLAKSGEIMLNIHGLPCNEIAGFTWRTSGQTFGKRAGSARAKVSASKPASTADLADF